jgi:hypothetical protein
MAKKQSPLVWLGGGAAVLAGYEFLLKPWLAAKNLGTPAGGGGGGFPSILPSWSGVTTPSSIGPAVNPGGVTGSIVDPRISPGGDVGQAMWRKGWTQLVATDRLNKLKAAFAQAMQAIAAMKSATANPAAAGIPAAEAEYAKVMSAALQAEQMKLAAQSRGDAPAVTVWAAAEAAHRQDALEIRARIAAAAAPLNVDQAALTRWESAAAGHKADYAALTGMTIPGG